jgi:hypothetical protein
VSAEADMREEIDRITRDRDYYKRQYEQSVERAREWMERYDAAKATPSSPSAGEAVRWDEAQFEGEPIMRGAVCMAKWAGWENPQANAERYFNVVRDVLATAQPLFPTPAPVVAVSEVTDEMMEAAKLAYWKSRMARQSTHANIKEALAAAIEFATRGSSDAQ